MNQRRPEPTTLQAEAATARGGLSFRKLAATQAPQAKVVGKLPGESITASGKILYKKGAEYVEQTLSAVRRRKGFAVDPGLQFVRRIADEHASNDQLFSLAIHLDEPLKYPVLHSVNVAVYAVRMAADLGYPRDQQVEIGLAGLLHDVGMAVMPEEIIYKRSPITAKEKEVLKARPDLSCRILNSLGADYAYLAECAAQVYERADGSGYPRGLRSDEISPYAQIIGLLDVWESLIHSRPHRPQMSSFAAIKELFNSSKNRFQRQHLKSLLNVFTVFPIHSYVRLNSGAVGKVIEAHAEQPLRPKLKIVLDANKRRILTPRIIDLPETPLLNIVDCVTDREIKAVFNGDALQQLSGEVIGVKVEDLVL